MWIANRRDTTLVNLDKCSQIFILEFNNAAAVCAARERSKEVVTICKCETKSDAIEVIKDIAIAIEEDIAVYYPTTSGRQT